MDASGGIMDIKVWRVPAPVPPGGHDYKYSLYYGRNGERLIGFDNERGKGDHMHIRGEERPLAFTTLEELLACFLGEVKREQGDDA